jgi:long-chain acyl-CoA synthetase
LIASGKNVHKIASLNESILGHITDIIVLDSPGIEIGPSVQRLTEFNIRVSTFDAVLACGRDVTPIVFAKVSPQDLSYVCHSSGTTGFPKGVMISHRCFISNLLGIFPEGVPSTFDVHLSYLPLCHVFERMCSSCVLHHGGRIGIFSGDVRLLTEDLMALHPTVMIVVPRVLQRISDKVSATLSESALKRFVFESAFSVKRWLLARDLPTGFLDAVVFNKVKRMLGGQMTMIVNGGAKLLPELHERIQVITGWPVRPGYGLSEGGSGNVVVPGRIPLIKLGSSGYPLANVELRILPVPDFNSPGEGEILMGGSGLCDGYLNDPEATHALFTDESRTWIHTGDVGKFDELNGLQVLDRMHSIFKLSQGEYVAADILASFFELADLVQSCFVYGDSTRASLVGIILPDAAAVAKRLGREAVSREELAAQCEGPALVAAVKVQIDAVARERNLLGYQKLSAFKLVVDEWTVENGALSPTFKPRRKALSERYRKEILQLYGQG